MQQKIDADFDGIVSEITNILQSERDRLVAISQKVVSCGLPFSYRRTEEFSNLLERLEKIQIGKLEVRPPPSSRVETPPQVVSSCDPPAQNSSHVQICDEKTRMDKNRSRKRASFARSLYDDMELVATLERKDLGASGPHSIISMPDRNCFAVLRPGRLNFVSPSGRLLSGHSVITDYDFRKKGGYCPSAIARHPLGNQFVCIDFGEIRSVPFGVWPPTEEIIEAKSRIGSDYEPPLGLAVSPSTDRLFTAFGRNIESFSLTDWQSRGKWHMGLIDKSNYPFILGLSGGKLFFKDKNFSTKLYTVGFDGPEGKLDLDSETVFADKFYSPKNVTFDVFDNVLVVDDRFCSFQVFDKDGERLCEKPCFTDRRTRGKPVSLATMSVPTGGDLFSFQDGQILCSAIVAVADFGNGSILFFGSSENH